MVFEQVPIGGDRNFAYILGDPGSGRAALIDPAYRPDRLVERAGELGLEVELIINTHSHPDHVNGNGRARELTRASIVCHESSARALGADRAVADGDVIELGSLRVRVLHTPGHSSDSICLVVGGKVITGDTLFVGKVGGTDLEEGARAEYDALHGKLMALPDDHEVYPGHDFGVRPSSTIGEERRTNPFLLRGSFEAFVDLKRNWVRYKTEHGIA